MSRTDKRSDARVQLEELAENLLANKLEVVDGTDNVYVLTPSSLADILDEYRGLVKDEIIGSLHDALEDLE
jgi:hypothetical protein